ncbi:MAG: hypothetical protein ACFFB5_04010 [Promethearchaeota archaeon]
MIRGLAVIQTVDGGFTVAGCFDLNIEYDIGSAFAEYSDVDMWLVMSLHRILGYVNRSLIPMLLLLTIKADHS